MKKVFIILLSFVILLSFSGCKLKQIVRTVKDVAEKAKSIMPPLVKTIF